MGKYHELEELAPRDVVARAIFSESKNGDVFLDLTHIEKSIILDKLTSSHTVAKHFAKVL
jgi:L-aspartate oxidase